ncbi:MAG: hypothetical protein ABI597_09965 [Gammaproteobacteria bacterium]
MKNLFKIIILLLSLSVFSIHADTYNMKYSSIEDFVSDQKTIRIFGVAVGNFGHLAATANVMTHVRQLGFKGTFEIIYPDMDLQSVTTLFNLPPQVPDIYEDETNKIRFIKLGEYIKRLKDNAVEPVTLGMSGAADDDDSACAWAGNTPLNNTDTLMCRNVAKLLNVKIYASVTHTNDHPFVPPMFQEFGDEFFLWDNNEKRYAVDEGNLYFTAPVSSLDDAKNYLQQNGDLLTKKPALNTFIDGMEKQRFDVMPVYGRTIHDSELDERIANMLQIITGARYAEVHNPSHAPLVIAVYYDYEEDAELLSQIIHSNNWTQLEGSWIDAAKNAIQTVGLNQPGVFSVASISDAKTINTLNTLQPNQILLLTLGSFPKTVFDGLYTHTGENIWPQIREGYSSLSSLMLTGKPHFRCPTRGVGSLLESNWELGFDLVKDTDLKTKLINFYLPNNGFCQGAGSWDKNSDIYKTFGELILQARSADSSFSEYFQVVKENASDPKKDRINDMLDKVMKFMNGDKSALGDNAIDLPEWTPFTAR